MSQTTGAHHYPDVGGGARRDGIVCARDAGVHQNAVNAQFHRHRRIRGGADACINDDRYFRYHLADNAQVVSRFRRRGHARARRAPT